MPICKRDGLNKKSPDKFHDNEKVFYCEATNEIFRDYDDYFQRVMLINSTIWSCSITGRENLTYAEALKSEKCARNKLATFKDILKAPALIAVQKSQQTSFKDLLLLTYQFLKERFFIDESIDACINKHYVECNIIAIIPPNEIPENGIIDPLTVKYKVQMIKKDKKEILIMERDLIRRHRLEFTHDNLKLFLRESVLTVNGVFQPKPDVYRKLVIDNNITFESLFIGKLPDWKPGKKPTVGRKQNLGFIEKLNGSKTTTNNNNNNHKTTKIKDTKQKDKKQETIAKYLQKKNGENKTNGLNESNKESNKEKMKAFKEQMERLRIEKEIRQAEIEERRLDRLAKLELETLKVMKKCDDLEREDQKPFPKFKEVKCLIRNEFFGDFLLVLEFLHAFSQILYDSRKTITIHQMCRALTKREVAGPLSDILQILLSTLFSLQTEEEEECAIRYATGKLPPNSDPRLLASVDASKTHLFIRRYFSRELSDLPIDATTLTEILRLHLLSSGAKTDDKSERWRFLYRNGFSINDDPGISLRLQHPDIIRSLGEYSVYQLPFNDIIKIINCLIEQILTHYGTTTLIEERLDILVKTRFQLRRLNAAENKRSTNVTNSKKVLAGEFYMQSSEHKNDIDKTKLLENQMNEKIESIDEQNATDKAKYELEYEQIKSSLFDFIVYLGTDRAYRNYFILESVCGLFIEHPNECLDICLENPPKNCTELAYCRRNKRDLRTFLSKRLKLSDKENAQKMVMNNNKKILNGDQPETITNGNHELTQYELYMCTGDPKNCIVHDEKNPDRIRWSYIDTEEELNALIESLNVGGERESILRERLIHMKTLILKHIQKCPSETLLLKDDIERNEYIKLMMNITQKKYQNANFGFPDNTDLNEILHACLLDRILQFENDITTGYLGKLKVKDLEKWRIDLKNGSYDAQCKLKYGITDTAIVFQDPGDLLKDNKPESEHSINDDNLGIKNASEIKEIIKNLASALLQIEQAIEQKFLKEPFGLKTGVDGKKKIYHWETALMNSTSFAQINLHLSVLSESVQWARSVNQSNCLVCRRRCDPDKMLLCDECNAGTHTFCLQPKLKKIPEGNWYCKRCEIKMGIVEIKPKRKPRKKIFSLDEEDLPEKKEDDEEYESDEEWSAHPKKKQNKGIKKRKVYTLEESFDEPMEDEEEEDDDDDDDEDANEAEEEEKEESSSKANSNDGEEDLDEVDEKVEEMGEADSVENDSDVEEDSDVDSKTTTNSTAKSDEQTCKICSFNDSDLQCGTCNCWFHLECTSLRRIPRGNWSCPKCNVKQNRKRKAEEKYELSDDSNETPAKKSRRSIQTLLSNNINNVHQNNKNSRRSRRTGDNLPLNNVILYDLLNDIMKHEDAWPFLRSVTVSEVPDYYEIIKKPMNFGKIKSNLNLSYYKTNEEVIQDIQLIFNNCDTYNSEGNNIYKAGASLEKFVYKKCLEFNLSYEPSDMISDLISDSKYI